MQTTAAPATVSRLDTLRRTNTPSRMRVAAGVTAVLAIVVAFVGSNAIAARRTTISEAARERGAAAAHRGHPHRHRRGRLARRRGLPGQRARAAQRTGALRPSLSAAQTGVVDAAAQAAEADVERSPRWAIP